tara:strand:+ start:1669 stop:2235 length:567 start_codon:yes stop_codon:yes gene_type:complete
MQTNNTRKYLESFGRYIVKQARTILTKKKKNVTKDLYNSLDFKVVETLFGYEVDFYMADYGAFVDKGVSGTKKQQEYTDPYGQKIRSPFKFGTGSSLVSKAEGGMSGIMSKWVKKKGFQWRDKQTGRFMSYKSMGYLIARSIYSRGIKSTAFYQRPLQLALPKFGVELASALVDDLRLEIKEINKNIK